MHPGLTGHCWCPQTPRLAATPGHLKRSLRIPHALYYPISGRSITHSSVAFLPFPLQCCSRYRSHRPALQLSSATWVRTCLINFQYTVECMSNEKSPDPYPTRLQEYRASAVPCYRQWSSSFVCILLHSFYLTFHSDYSLTNCKTLLLCLAKSTEGTDNLSSSFSTNLAVSCFWENWQILVHSFPL